MMYLLSCKIIENGGGIYACNLTENGSLQQTGCFSYDIPVYALKCEIPFRYITEWDFCINEKDEYFWQQSGNKMQYDRVVFSIQEKCNA